MKNSRSFTKRHGTLFPLLILISLAFLCIPLFLVDQNEGFAEAPDALSNADCIKCHAKVQSIVDEKGNKHKTEVACMECHQGHPPMVSKEKIIPVCGDCHAGKPHYEIGGCATCHSDPHAPLDMQLASNLTDPCLSCHPGQGTELKDHPSLHTKLACTSCHAAHKEVPPCMSCHKPHSEDMRNPDCLTCHPAHQPLTIEYGEDMPSVQCAACHGQIFNKLSQSDTKHSALACAFCHKEKHGMVPGCESCHGSPHPAGMMNKFKTCDNCHISAHTLGKEVNQDGS